MRVRYINYVSDYDNKPETIDEMEINDKYDQIALKNLLKEYRLAGMRVYQSQRCCNNWKDK